MRRIPTMATAVVLACGACQPLPDASLAAPTAGQPQPAPTASAQPPAVQPSCTSYTVPVTVGGQPQQAVVEACQQADGSWRITQTTPGLPPQVYEVPPPAYSPYPSAYPYPDFSPSWDWAGARIGVGRTLPGFSASHRRSSSYSASTISTMASLTASPTGSVMGLPEATGAA